jgi:hypothetical protein
MNDYRRKSAKAKLRPLRCLIAILKGAYSAGGLVSKKID